MKDAEKWVGAALLALGLLDLVRHDWLGGTLLLAAGALLTAGPKRLRLPRGVETGLAALLCALVVARLVMRLAG